MTMGCEAYAESVPEEDAFAVKRLRAAGAVIPGKTNTCQFAIGGTGETSYRGPVRNPHDPERVTGGSSSGSACAVGGGIVPAAIGSDTGGSIRIPSSLCGAVGMKPTYSLISTDKVIPLGPSLDTLGPIADIDA